MRANDVGAYLDRIGLQRQDRAGLTSLAELQRAHLRTVPFENLDIALGRPIRLTEPDLFEKIVTRRRGGFCFELNGLFAALLRALGFGVTLVAAQFPRDGGQIVPEFDHLALLVDDPSGDAPWLVDVGAGRGSPASPLRLVPALDQFDPITRAWYRIDHEGAGLRLIRRQAHGAWQPDYWFTGQPRTLAEFSPGCHHHQTSPESPFTQGRICTLLTTEGRITLSERRLIETIGTTRIERDVADDDEVALVLWHRFGIDLALPDDPLPPIEIVAAAGNKSGQALA